VTDQARNKRVNFWTKLLLEFVILESAELIEQEETEHFAVLGQATRVAERWQKRVAAQRIQIVEERSNTEKRFSVVAVAITEGGVRENLSRGCNKTDLDLRASKEKSGVRRRGSVFCGPQGVETHVEDERAVQHELYRFVGERSREVGLIATRSEREDNVEQIADVIQRRGLALSRSAADAQEWKVLFLVPVKFLDERREPLQLFVSTAETGQWNFGVASRRSRAEAVDAEKRCSALDLRGEEAKEKMFERAKSRRDDAGKSVDVAPRKLGAIAAGRV
jgi:hypothetical protein